MDIIRLSPHIKIREENFGYLVYNLETYSLYQVNKSGKRILDLCKQGKEKIELEKLINHNQQIKEKMNQFIIIMIKLGILEEVKDIE